MNLKQLCVNVSYVVKNILPVLFLSREKKITDNLIKNALKISTAESCTGGLISSRLTDISGSSAYIFQNFVTYANKAKVELLGVEQDTINKFGVVSEETAAQMAEGLLNKYDCSVALSVTGIAGPLGASETKPVGLVCIAVADKNMTKTYSYYANPLLCRRIMKYAFSNKALELLLEFLEENYKS